MVRLHCNLNCIMFVRPKWVSMVKMSCSIAFTFMQLTTSDGNIIAPKIINISADMEKLKFRIKILNNELEKRIKQ